MAETKKPITDDDWQLQATLNAIQACRDIVREGDIKERAIIGSLNDIEWGWLVAAAIFAWIKTRAEQAVAEGLPPELPIRAMRHDPEPWEAGAVESILQALSNLQGIDWDKPVGQWSREQITYFVYHAYRLTTNAVSARDSHDEGKIVQQSQQQVEREVSAANGGPLMSRDELKEQPPF